MATFNLLTDLKGGLDFVISAWLIILCSSIPIGLACGFVASKYVSSKLAIIHSTTKFWKNSDFSKRINWIKDDELGKHALFLNEMADELEKNFYLRQQIAVTNERNMVARALHDTVKQKLFALSLQIATIKSKISENEKIQPILSEAEAITSEAQYELMSIITKLKPAEINHLSCIAEIRKKSKELNRRLGIKIHINMADDIAIEQQHLLNIIKIIDESIINAVKHGRANEATISLFKKDKSNYLYIDDNGTGIKNFSFFTGIGINSMKERSHEIAESVLDIVNIKESGVRVSLVWPA